MGFCKCFLHTTLSCYLYSWTPNFQLCILTVGLNGILDTSEVSFVTISFLIPSIWKSFWYLSSFQMPFCGDAGLKETGSSIFLVFPISNFLPLVPNLWKKTVSFCAVTFNSHFYLDFPYREQLGLPVLTAEFLLHIWISVVEPIFKVSLHTLSGMLAPLSLYHQQVLPVFLFKNSHADLSSVCPSAKQIQVSATEGERQVPTLPNYVSLCLVLLWRELCWYSYIVLLICSCFRCKPLCLDD